jgi:DNA-binding MltR family transcriptional regulator
MVTLDNVFARMLRRRNIGVAIACAAILDEQLRRAILTKLRALTKDLSARLFDGYGPLSSFAAKIDLAYALDLITREMHADLTTIRTLRNRFAHSTALLDVDSSEIRSLLKKFKAFDEATTNCETFYLGRVREIDSYFDRIIEGRSKSTGDQEST